MQMETTTTTKTIKIIKTPKSSSNPVSREKQTGESGVGRGERAANPCLWLPNSLPGISCVLKHSSHSLEEIGLLGQCC